MQLSDTQPDLTFTERDTFAVYEKHWITALAQVAGVDEAMDHQAASAKVAEAFSICQQFYAQNYEGKVMHIDTACDAEKIGGDVVVRLKIKLPILLGEFTSLVKANEYVDSGFCGPNTEIVVRGSAREKEIANYGNVMLPAA